MNKAEIYDEWAALAGMRCICRPECTVGDIWGDGPNDCKAQCEPCRIMNGREYHKPPKADGRYDS